MRRAIWLTGVQFAGGAGLAAVGVGVTGWSSFVWIMILCATIATVCFALHVNDQKGRL